MSEEGKGEGEGDGSSWRDGLSEEYRDSPVLADMADIDALARDHINVQSLIGKKGVIPPKEGDDAGVWNKFYNDIGRPASSDDYSFEGATWSDDFGNAIRKAAYDIGLDPHRAGMFGAAIEQAHIADKEASDGAATTKREEAVAQLKKDFGAALGAKADLAARALSAVLGEHSDAITGLRLEDGTNIVDHPDFIRGLAAFGARMGEAEIIGDKGKGPTIPTPEEAEHELATLRRDENFSDALHDAHHPDHKAALKKKNALSRAMYAESA